tara:strand:- start:1559 stop:1714 length:156 start_codon:yes stop_codon:yes gene_type:complete
MKMVFNGKKHSKETRRKMSKALKGESFQKNTEESYQRRKSLERNQEANNLV